MDVAIADRRQEIVDSIKPEGRRNIVQVHVVETQPLQLLLDQIAATCDVLVPLLTAKPLANLLAGAGGLDVAEIRIEPVSTRALRPPGGNDLDNVAVLQPVVQRDHPTVDLGPDTLMPDLGVYAISEVERRGAGRHLFDLTLRREDVHLILEKIRLERIDELLSAAGNVLLPIH